MPCSIPPSQIALFIANYLAKLEARVIAKVYEEVNKIIEKIMNQTCPPVEELKRLLAIRDQLLNMLNLGIKLTELGIIPESVLRIAIKKIIQQRLLEIPTNTEERESKKADFIEELRSGPIALSTQQANEQHYEVPPAFFKNALGKHLKYSSGYWPNGIDTLDDSELAMLKLSSERAELSDGIDILELGCGWGSLTLFMAENYPKSHITAVSNSKDQRIFIEKKCQERGLENVKVITADMNEFTIDDKFERIVSVEMFEHMRNYEQLLDKVSSCDLWPSFCSCWPR